MAYVLGDVFVGNFQETQSFGARPDFYSARYGIRGHNGVDFGCPSLTMVLSAANGFVSEIGFDKGGYGNYIKIVHEGYLTLYGHLNSFVVSKNDHVVAGQLIAHSDNTGNSDAPHLHFGVAPCDSAGNKTEQSNGYSGYIDPNGSFCQWQIKNLSAPVNTTQVPSETDITLPSPTFVLLRTKSTNYDVSVSFLLSVGLNDYLSTHGLPIIDLNKAVQDPKDGEHIQAFLAEKFSQLKDLQSSPPPNQVINEQILQKAVSTLTPEQKTGLLKSIFSAIGGFVFTQH